MKIKIRRLALSAGLGIAPLLLGGCFFNLFQTAKTLDQGEVLLGIGVGMVAVAVEEGTALFYTPQLQLGIGLADGAQLAFRAGALAVLGDSPGMQFGGASGEFKFRLFDGPGTFALALGLGAGWGFDYLGWGLHGSLYFDSNVPFLPLYLAGRPFLSLGAMEDTGMGFGGILAGGLKLRFSEAAMLLVEADYHTVWGTWSPGVSFLFSL